MRTLKALVAGISVVVGVAGVPVAAPVASAASPARPVAPTAGVGSAAGDTGVIADPLGVVASKPAGPFGRWGRSEDAVRFTAALATAATAH